MIEIKITVPNDEVGDDSAVQRRMRMLGYAPLPVGGVQASPTQVFVSEATLQRAEAEAADETIIEAAKAMPEPKPEPKKRGRPAKAEAAPNISAHPEARVDPEVEAQDEADEAAEVAAAAPANEVVTPETLRAEMGAYAQKFGMDAALADGTAIFTDALGQAPDGGWKLSVVAGIGGETLAKAVVAWRAAAAGSARYAGRE